LANKLTAAAAGDLGDLGEGEGVGDEAEAKEGELLRPPDPVRPLQATLRRGPAPGEEGDPLDDVERIPKVEAEDRLPKAAPRAEATVFSVDDVTLLLLLLLLLQVGGMLVVETCDRWWQVDAFDAPGGILLLVSDVDLRGKTWMTVDVRLWRVAPSMPLALRCSKAPSPLVALPRSEGAQAAVVVFVDLLLRFATIAAAACDDDKDDDTVAAAESSKGIAG
jgi:hypothetical protein